MQLVTKLIIAIENKAVTLRRSYMNKRKYLSILLALAMVVTVIPVAGLAASNDPSGKTDPLGVKVYSGDNEISVYYMPFEDGYNDDKKYEVYIRSDKLDNGRLKILLKKDLKDKVTFEDIEIDDQVDIQNKKRDADPPYD